MYILYYMLGEGGGREKRKVRRIKENEENEIKGESEKIKKNEGNEEEGKKEDNSNILE